ncbi:hypothetical protein AGMMS49525_04170 [Bacteroidia bacterium]|nr:hypothetical protein AGMMS49525_04170 [Bacteroidia bacterium]
MLALVVGHFSNRSVHRVDYQDMHLFAKERGHLLPEILQLPHGAPSLDTFGRVFRLIEPTAQTCLETYGKEILGAKSFFQVLLFSQFVKIRRDKAIT